MKVSVLNTHHYLKMPWKNGQGYTLQLACSHQTADFFDWRISIADVEQDSAFSFFEGKARAISILKGHGLILQNQNSQHEVQLKQNDVYCFSGEEPIYSKLINGAIQDFNLIYNPQKYTAQMQWLNQVPYLHSDISAKFIFLYNSASFDLNVQVEDKQFTLQPHHLLKIEDVDCSHFKVTAETQELSFYLIQLT